MRLGALALFALCAGCPGSLDDPARFTGATSLGAAPAGGNVAVDAAACGDVPQTIFQRSCVNAGCHNANDKVQGLDLQSPDLVTRLVDVRASEGAGLLVNRGTLSDSVLYTKLTKSPPFGARMPLSGALDDASIACVFSWITEIATSPNDDAGDHDAGALEDSAPEDSAQADALAE